MDSLLGGFVREFWTREMPRFEPETSGSVLLFFWFQKWTKKQQFWTKKHPSWFASLKHRNKKLSFWRRCFVTLIRETTLSFNRFGKDDPVSLFLYGKLFNEQWFSEVVSNQRIKKQSSVSTHLKQRNWFETKKSRNSFSRPFSHEDSSFLNYRYLD